MTFVGAAVRRSKSLLRSIALLTALAAADRAGAATISVAAAMRGPRAPAILAAVINKLADQQPDLLFSPPHMASETVAVPGVCGPSIAAGTVRSCTFWDAMIAHGAWPVGAPLLDKVQAHFAAGKDYRLPNVIVSVGQSVVTSTMTPARGAPSEDEKRALCRRQRWSNSATDLDCVLEVVPIFGLPALRSQNRRVIVRQRVIRLVVPDVPEDKAAAVRKTMHDAINAFGASPGSSATVEEDLAARQLFVATAPPSCDDASLRKDADTARALIDWPNTQPASPTTAGAVAFIELDNALFPNPRFQYQTTASIPPDWPPDAVSLVHHPMFAGSEWALDCTTMLGSVPVGHLSHTMAVASVLSGQPVRLKSATGAVIKMAPLLPASPLEIDILHALWPGENQIIGNGPQSQVIVASVQSNPPAPSSPPSYKRSYKVVDYRSLGREWTTLGRILVTAAPVGTVMDLDPDPTDNFACAEWPSCLDSLGTTITVAAIDNQGAIMRAEPGSGLPYELTPRTVSVAAPGDSLPVVANGPAGPTIALASGTSVAAPVVAAIALRMRGFPQLSDPLSAYDIVAGIEATADLSRHFDVLRFGVVNARRAFAVAALPLHGAVVSAFSDDEQSDAKAPPRTLTEIRGISPVPATCRVAAAQTNRGVFLYYRDGDPVRSASGDAYPPDCLAVSQLLRIRQTPGDVARRTYTIVFHDLKPDEADNPYPHILRNVYFEPPSAFADQCVIAGGTPGAPLANQPCLTGVDSTGRRVSIDLIHIDAAFQPSGWKE